MECLIGDPLDNLVYFDGEFEPELRLFLSRLDPAPATIIDVGCNIGYVSCLLATLTAGRARIISVDANPEMARRCEANLKLNGFRAEVCHSAAGSVEESRTFHIPRNRPSYASFGQLEHDCEDIVVPIRRLDRLAAEKGLTHIDLLKIDVEGFEPQVLRGLGELPVRNICLEFSDDNLKNCGFTAGDLWELPLWKNYRLFLLEKGTARPLEFRPNDPIPNETEIVWGQAVR